MGAAGELIVVIADWFIHHKRFGRFKRLFEARSGELRPLATFPQILHFYWDQGLEEAPDLVRRCIGSWQAHHPGWTICIWDAAQARQLVDRDRLPSGLKTTPYSDILRTCILDEIGGIWVDATVLCRRPVEPWLPMIMAQCDFFAFRRPGPDREIASWFMAARPGTALIGHLRREVLAFWGRRRDPTRVYHWFHYLFEYQVRRSAAFRAEWRQTPALSAAPMIQLQEVLAGRRHPDEVDGDLLRALPMHKLTYKHAQDWALFEQLIPDLR